MLLVFEPNLPGNEVVAIGDNLGMAGYCHQLDVEGVGILEMGPRNRHAASKEVVHVGGEGAGAVAVKVELLECVPEIVGVNYVSVNKWDLATISVAVVEVGNVEGEPVGHSVVIINLAIPVLEPEDCPLKAVPYLVKVTVADWTEGPASIIGVTWPPATAASAAFWLVHVPVLDNFTDFHVVLVGNSILSSGCFSGHFFGHFPGQFFAPLN